MKQTIPGISALRGLAALVIAQFHLYFLNSVVGYPFQRVLALGYTYGWFMVEFFWLLSGFLLFSAYRSRIAGGGLSFYEFFYGRLARIYPLFMVTTVAMVCLVFIAKATGTPYAGSNTVVNFLQSVFCIHYVGLSPPEHSFNIPAWFITDLLICYGLFFFVVKVSRTKGDELRNCFLLICLGLAMFRIYQIAPDKYFPFFNLDLGRALISFFTGYLLSFFCLQSKNMKKRTFVAWIAIILVCYPALKRFEDRSFEGLLGDARIFCSLFLFPLFLYAVINTKWICHFLEMKVFVWLGNISYSIFLWHYPIIQTIKIISTVLRWQIPYNSPIFLLIYYFVLLSVAYLSYRFIEIPFKEVWMKKQQSVLSFLKESVIKE